MYDYLHAYWIAGVAMAAQSYAALLRFPSQIVHFSNIKVIVATV
jgi:hypothetical protein